MDSSSLNVIALISGGKDSIFNIMKCVQQGHKIIALANLYPIEMGKEIDSYMYQSVGGHAIENLAQAMGKPLYRKIIEGKPKITDLEYNGSKTEKEGDEVEDLYLLLKEIKEKHPEANAVSSGAIASTYQKLRVEEICKRLDMVSLAYLWNRDQKELLKEMIDSKMEILIIKTASYGLYPDNFLGKVIDEEIYEKLVGLGETHGLNVCGEGGEYESLTLNCPLFSQILKIDETERINHSFDKYSPVSYLKIKSCSLIPKN